jgi:hypothetical protein
MTEQKIPVLDSANKIDEANLEENVLVPVTSHAIQRPPVPLMNWEKGDVGWESEDDVANPQ